VLSKDWGQFNLLQTGGSFAGQKKNVRPQTAAAHDTVALRRLPHAKAWKQTDAYQDLLKKKYKVTQKSAIQKSSQGDTARFVLQLACQSSSPPSLPQYTLPLHSVRQPLQGAQSIDFERTTNEEKVRAVTMWHRRRLEKSIDFTINHIRDDVAMRGHVKRVCVSLATTAARQSPAGGFS
jgi:hypothetical protein